ncbi:MAG: hypothetical protein IPK13_07465 [Deltaproteobacteria bacterium]|nr:hypothetical protein [Deltaproteobacteria bacterium]
MAGLDLPVKLRRGIGNGKVVPEDELARRLKKFDQDGDGALIVGELAEFFKESQVGGPWFSQTVAKTIWRMAEERWARSIPTIAVEALARVIHLSMSQPPRQEKRYVITPEVMQG